MTKDQLAKKYQDWEIKEFSKEKVILYNKNPPLTRGIFAVITGSCPQSTGLPDKGPGR